MTKNKNYRFLMSHTTSLLKTYSYDELFDIGRVLSYTDRICFDYKLVCRIRRQKYCEFLSRFYNEEEFLKKLIEKDELLYIVDNIEEIIRPNLLRRPILKYLKKNIDRIPEYKKERIKEHIVLCVSEHQSFKKDDNLFVLKNLLEKVAEREQLTLFDIKKINYGGYTKVYQIGDKIIKIGFKRVCKTIPDNRRLLIPDFKGYIGRDFVEVTDYLECFNDADYDEIYEVYKELRDQGIRWLDPTRVNITRVNKKVSNSIKAKRQVLKLKDIGIIENEDKIEEELGLGEYVIIDLDHMFWDYELDKIDKARMDLNEDIMGTEDLYDIKYRREKEALRKKM